MTLTNVDGARTVFVMRAWWGHMNGDELVLVARTPAAARSLVGMSADVFPYRFEPTERPAGAETRGIYIKDGDRWVLRQKLGT